MVVVGKRDYAVFFMHLSFVHDTDCPLSGIIESAADASAAFYPDCFKRFVTLW